MTKKAPIGWDTETHMIKPGMTAPRMVCLSAAFADTKDVRLLDREQGLDMAENLIESDFTVGHHIFFDLGVVAAERPRLVRSIFDALDAGRVHDTIIRQKMIDNARGELKYVWDEDKGEYKKQNYALWRLIWKHKGYSIQHKKEGVDIWRLRYHELDGVPIERWPEEAKSYAIGDAVETRDIWLSQEEKDVAPDEIPGFESEMQAAWALNLMGTWGMRTEESAVAVYKAELEADYAKQVSVCQEFEFRRKGVKTSKDMKQIRAVIEAWYKDRGLPFKLTDGGKKNQPQVATDREQLTGTDHPGLLAVAESGKIEKLLSTYIPALERAVHVPLNPNYNPIIETFRTSCSGGMKIDGVPVGMNVQNLPRGGKVRACVVPREGWVFVFCDYDTLEMLTLAQTCLELFGYSEIANAANAGQDFHLALAADMFEIPYRDAHARYERGDKEIANARQFCKIGNYGFGGGMGPRAFVDYAKGYGITVSMDLAKKLHAGFRRKWTEMNDYFVYCSNLCAGGNAEKIIFPRSNMVRGDVKYTAVCNGFFQHRAAKGAKEAVYRVSKECYCDAGSPLYGSRPWLFAHDEIGMEIPYEAIGPRRAHEAAMRLQAVMVEAMRMWCPDVPIGATVAMTRRWHKGAKPLFKDGLLVPCKPSLDKKGWIYDAG
jgi:DNA polymerase I-like protein with 3'-5' exonuclease and polymerase domains